MGETPISEMCILPNCNIKCFNDLPDLGILPSQLYKT